MKKLANLIIIDASGSMQDKKDEVIGGVKQLLTSIQEDAKKDKKGVRTTTVVTDFSSSGDFNVLVSSPDSISLDTSLADKYSTRGMTALYDAISKSFALIPKDTQSVFVSIITDGQENDSKEMDKKKVKALIEQMRRKNWVVTFMGTTEDALAEAQSFGVSRGNTFCFTDNAVGMMSVNNRVSAARQTYYDTVVSANCVSLAVSAIGANLMDIVDEDIKNERG